MAPQRPQSAPALLEPPPPDHITPSSAPSYDYTTSPPPDAARSPHAHSKHRFRWSDTPSPQRHHTPAQHGRRFSQPARAPFTACQKACLARYTRGMRVSTRAAMACVGSSGLHAGVAPGTPGEENPYENFLCVREASGVGVFERPWSYRVEREDRGAGREEKKMLRVMTRELGADGESPMDRFAGEFGVGSDGEGVVDGDGDVGVKPLDIEGLEFDSGTQDGESPMDRFASLAAERGGCASGQVDAFERWSRRIEADTRGRTLRRKDGSYYFSLSEDLRDGDGEALILARARVSRDI